MGLHPEHAVNVAHDALRPRYGIRDDCLCARADAIFLKIFFAELLHDQNPCDDRHDALAAFVHKGKSTLSPFVRPQAQVYNPN